MQELCLQLYSMCGMRFPISLEGLLTLFVMLIRLMPFSFRNGIKEL